MVYYGIRLGREKERIEKDLARNIIFTSIGRFKEISVNSKCRIGP